MEDSVTTIRCRHCHRSAEVALIDGRFWCAWCQRWAEIELERVRGVTVERGESDPRLRWTASGSYPLQPLRIPTGWKVENNGGLYEIDPVAELVTEMERCGMFHEDMLHMTHSVSNRMLDVGWYPECDLEDGQYKLVVHEGDFGGRLLHEFRTRTRFLLVGEIERVLTAVCRGQL